MLSVYASTKFKKDVKRLVKQGKDMEKLKAVIEKISNNQPLPESFHDHKLSGDWEGFRDCHIEPDWVLIYRIEEKRLILALMRMGSHTELNLS